MTMLLPSALACEPAQSSHARLRSALFVSPPASPPALSQTAFANIMTTCRSLQSLMVTPPASAPSLASLPTPPLAHAPPPLKLRLRARPGRPGQDAADDGPAARRRIVKRAATPRGANKRRRADEDDMGRDDVSDGHVSDGHDGVGSDIDVAAESTWRADGEPAPPSTPKRARIAPEQLPLGLERSDFHDMHLLNRNVDDKPGTDVHVEADGAEWSAEDDRVLVELVLEKLRLSKTEWQDCARSLGKDRHSLSRRWKSLMMKGDVGLKTRPASRRARLHATWR